MGCLESARAVNPRGPGHLGTKPDSLATNQSGDNHMGSSEQEKSHG